ncbi:hypothetical protein BV898_17596 [Hypsibius exemplaris]|uniref:Chitin-binding type-2 domain-containing protein n=1 Tax=Hypsibius exemplaris TaxID=2072580 RepID=A0A9X6NFU0_HYPEX|nr:hypothetical protein BV898_17596 [Hypsibius exemplaris]
MHADGVMDLLLHAQPGVTYPIMKNGIPATKFVCSKPGFYADVETNCQVFHRCEINGGNMTSYFCVDTTVFNQVTLVCDYWFNVDCDRSVELADFANSRLYTNRELFDTPPKEYTSPNAVRITPDATQHEPRSITPATLGASSTTQMPGSVEQLVNKGPDSNYNMQPYTGTPKSRAQSTTPSSAQLNCSVFQDGLQCGCRMGHCWAYKNPAGHITPQAAPNEPWCYTDKVGAPHGQHGCSPCKVNGDCSWAAHCRDDKISTGKDTVGLPECPNDSMQATTTNSPSTRFHVVGQRTQPVMTLPRPV